MPGKQRLKHDAQGFLLGESVDLKALLSSWASMRSDIHSIAADVHTMRRALQAARPTPVNPIAVPSRAKEASSSPTSSIRLASDELRQTVVSPKSRVRRPRAPLSQATPTRSQSEQAANVASGLKSGAKVAIVQKDATQAVVPRGNEHRDAKGRFIGGQKSSASLKHETEDKHGDSWHEAVNIGARSVAAAKAVGAGLEDADPTVKAFNEIAQPLTRSFEALTGGGQQKRHNRWLRRIWQSLTGSRKEQGLFNKVAAKRLKAIEEKPVANTSGGNGFLSGMLAMLAGLFAKVPGLKNMLSVAAMSAAGTATAAGIGKGSQEAGKPPGRIARLLRRVPILGALIGGAGLAGDLYASETDVTQTRAQKDRRAGQGVGGFAGAVGGMVGGAKMGALAGAFGGPIGAAIGGFVGGALGLFLGDQAGQIIGDKMGGWVSSLRDADIPGKIASAWSETLDWIKSGWSEVKSVALGTWDWMKSAWEAVTDTIKSGWRSATNSIMSGWEATKKAAESAKGWMVEKGNAANDAIHEATGINIKAGVGRVVDGAADLASKAKDGAVHVGESIANGAKNLKDAIASFGSRTADKLSDTAGQAWSGVKSLTSRAIPQALRDKVAVRRSMETAADYRQGNIAGLDNAHTRALIASTAETESSGGKLDVVNSAGYMGRYQAGAAWLADAGLLKGGAASVQAAMKADGFNNEWKWAQSGGMTRFLKNTSNWKEGLSYESYLASADTQDAAFKTNSDKTYRWLMSQNLIGESTSQAEIAGLLKARHISGHGGAKQVARGGTGPIDANGTSARKYYDDLASGSIYIDAFSANKGFVLPREAIAVAPATARFTSDVPVAAPPVLAPTDIQASVAPVSVSVSAPKIPSVPTVQSVPDAPPVIVPLPGKDTGSPISVVTVPVEVGQDLRERGIAHVVTGGLNGGV